MEINLEAIDAVRERTGCSYSDAKAALEASGGSVVDAIIYLEQRSDKGSELLEKVKAAVKEGNVNKIRLKRGDEVLLTVPVTVGIGVGVVGLAALPWWGLLLVIVGIMLLISGPSCFIAWGKLRRRNLGPVLNANGWAINSSIIVNIPFGRTLTSIAKYPKLKLDDPYKPKAPLWWRILRWVLLAAVIAFCALFFTDNLKCIGLPFHKEKPAEEQVEAVAPEAAAEGETIEITE